MSHYENLEIISQETGLEIDEVESWVEENEFAEVTDDIVDDIIRVINGEEKPVEPVSDDRSFLVNVNVNFGEDEEDPTYIRGFRGQKAFVSVRTGDSPYLYIVSKYDSIEVRYFESFTLTDNEIIAVSGDTGNTWTLDILGEYAREAWTKNVRSWRESYDESKLSQEVVSA